MANKVGWFQGFSGINNVDKATKIGITQEGVTGLETASNVFVDSGGDIETVPEGVLTIAGVFHSIWGLKDTFYCVKDEATSSTIYYGSVVDGAFVLRTVVTGLIKAAKVSYTVLGEDVYYSNGIDYGYIDGVVRYAWPSQVNTRLPNLVDFVPGTHITVLAGRMLSINGDEIRFTESFLPGLTNDNKNRRRLNSAGRMICSVGSGAYVSDEDCVYFLSGVNPNEWKLDKVLEYPAIEYGYLSKLIDPSFFGFQTKQPALLFNTVNGLCLGLATGEVTNLIDVRYRTDADYSSIALFEKSLAILSTDSEGILVQGVNEEIGSKSVTEWDGGYNSLFVTNNNEVVGANDSGLSLLWGQVDVITAGLEMLIALEMLATLEML